MTFRNKLGSRRIAVTEAMGSPSLWEVNDSTGGFVWGGLGAFAIAVLLIVLTIGFRNQANDAGQTQAVASVSLSREVVEPATVPSTATTIAPTTTTTTPPRTATLAFTGDTLAHRSVVEQAQTYASRAAAPEGAQYDFAPMFELVEPYLSAADIAICHLETPLSPDNTRLSGFPTFNVPREMADGLATAGYDGCTFASNHSLDQWPEGVADSLEILDNAGLQHSGAARSEAEFLAPTIYDANGIQVASLSYSYGFNGFREPEETPWLVNEINLDEIAAEAQAAREAGADYVVLSVHWGSEYVYDPDQFQTANAEQFAALDGIDIVIGHHAHVVQPVATVDGLPVVFGLGNFLSNQSANCCVDGSQDGMIMNVHLNELANGSFETTLSYVPTRVDRTDFTIVPVNDALAEPGLATLPAAELVASKERTAEVVYRQGRTDVTEVGPN